MTTAVNKRRFEELEDCNSLHVKGVRADQEFLQSEEFKTLYLTNPCNCCGSTKHSLLGIKNQLRTRTNRIQYEYTCPVASYEDIDKIDKKYPNNRLTISFWLDSENYAIECQYSPTIARSKFMELENSITAGYEVIMERFKSLVIEVCQDNMEIRLENKKRRRETLEKERELMFIDTFLTRPCRICGGVDHSVLRASVTTSGEIRYIYECPSALADDYETVKHRTIRCRLQICPIKFAQACNGERTRVIESYTKVEKQQGEWMKGKVTTFLEIALQHCYDGSAKRAKINTSNG